MAKQIKFNSEIQNKLLTGVQTLSKAVKATLGPRGRNVMIDNGGSVRVTKDGVSVAKEIELEDKFENMGAAMVREAAARTADKAGDGTTTATVLAEAIFTEGLKHINTGFNPIFVKRGIDRATNIVVETLKTRSQKISSSTEIEQVGTISANGDKEIGSLIADAMGKVGKDGIITVQESKGIDTTLSVVDGMQFDRGWVSSYFAKEGQTEITLDNPYILIHDKRISNVKDVMEILQAVSQSGKPLLIIAEDLEGEALPTIVVNNLRGTIHCVAVKCPAFGDNRKAILEDIAVLTGGTVISEDRGLKLDQASMEHLGTAVKVTVSKDATTIVQGGGDAEKVKARAASIRSQMEASRSDYDESKLQERLAKLTGGVAVLSVGGASETELKEKKDRIDDALHATKAAVESGILAGGGMALYNCIKEVNAVLEHMSNETEDEKIGMSIVARALVKPFITLCQNAGYSADSILTMLQMGNEKETETSTLPYNKGVNIVNGEIVDMIKSGIVDPAKVTITAIQSAASVAGMLLTTECGITTLPEKNPAPVPMPGYPPMM